MTKAPYPDTQLYPDWKSWARGLVKHLRETETRVDSEPVYTLPKYYATGLPSAANAGLLIFIEDEDKAAISTATGGWKRVRFVT